MSQQTRFEIFLGETVVGWTHFEFGDPPLGVAFGRLYPLIDLSSWQLPTESEKIPLAARRADGRALTPCSHVFVGGTAEDPESLAVSICGLQSDIYDQLFSHHVREYHERFKD